MPAKIEGCPFCISTVSRNEEPTECEVPSYIIKHEAGCFLRWRERLRGGSDTNIGGWNGQGEIDSWNRRAQFLEMFQMYMASQSVVSGDDSLRILRGFAEFVERQRRRVLV
jgi:hypothetical protein